MAPGGSSTASLLPKLMKLVVLSCHTPSGLTPGLRLIARQRNLIWSVLCCGLLMTNWNGFWVAMLVSLTVRQAPEASCFCTVTATIEIVPPAVVVFQLSVMPVAAAAALALWPYDCWPATPAV